MLVLKRKKGEAVFFNDDISIRILSVQGKCVKLGIEAPQEVAIAREEIHPKSLEQKAEGSGL